MLRRITPSANEGWKQSNIFFIPQERKQHQPDDFALDYDDDGGTKPAPKKRPPSRG